MVSLVTWTVPKGQEKVSTCHSTGLPWGWGSPALPCPILGHLALVNPVGLSCSLLPGAAGHGLDEIILIHQLEHSFLPGRHRAAP